MVRTNEHGQPVGDPLGDWNPPTWPTPSSIEGRTVTLAPLDPAVHGDGLAEVLVDAPAGLYTYMSFGPFADGDDLEATLKSFLDQPDWLPYAIVVKERPLGFASYLRIQPRDGVIEIGSIVFSPGLQRTTAATEAIYLMMQRVFELGFRRCEWKCDDLNEPSRVAALRLGFSYEGTFRHATHYKGRNRDTAWYAITDGEWPAMREVFQEWLLPANFDRDGRQRRSLREIREGR